MTDDQKEAIRQALDAMASARSVIDSDRTALIDANTNSTGAIVDEAAGYQIDEYDYALGAIDAAADRLARAMRDEQEWTPDDTAHRPGGLAQECPVMDLGGDIQQTTGLRGGLVQTVALAKQEVEPAPEPVAWRWKLVPDGMWHYSDMAAPPPYQSFPLYTNPPRREWVGLTDEEKRAFAFGWWKAMEKRNAEQEAEPVHEPPFVFRRYVSGEERAQNIVIERAASLDAAMAKAALICPQRWMTVLVYSPPRREWQGLTDEEQAQVAWSVSSITADWKEFYRAVEAALKEKNHD